jgi:hypothetical protein
MAITGNLPKVAAGGAALVQVGKPGGMVLVRDSAVNAESVTHHAEW